MRFSVSVPVLSEQMTVTEPSVSTAGSLRINARRLSMRWAPSARVMVTTAGSPSGTTATAMLMEVMIIRLRSSPRSRPRPKITPTSRGGERQAAAQLIETALQRRRRRFDPLDHVGDAAQLRWTCRCR